MESERSLVSPGVINPTQIWRAVCGIDSDLGMHMAAVALRAGALARTIGLENADSLLAVEGGLVHDIGKKSGPIAIAAGVPRRLRLDEEAVIHLHPDVGAAMLQQMGIPAGVTGVVAMHHELLDGSGYPGRLTEAKIPAHVQCVTAADIFEALRAPRVYKRGLTTGAALTRMHLMADRGQLNPEIVGALHHLVMEGQPEVRGVFYASEPSSTKSTCKYAA